MGIRGDMRSAIQTINLHSTPPKIAGWWYYRRLSKCGGAVQAASLYTCGGGGWWWQVVVGVSKFPPTHIYPIVLAYHLQHQTTIQLIALYNQLLEEKRLYQSSRVVQRKERIISTTISIQSTYSSSTIKGILSLIELVLSSLAAIQLLYKQLLVLTILVNSC